MVARCYRGPPGARLPGRGTAFFPKESGGKERAGGSFLRWLRVDSHRRCPRHLRPPAPPNTGVHGGKRCTGQAKTGRASTPGSFLCPSQALPRLGLPASITRQALTAAALYQVRPPGRRRCHAAEILWRPRRRTARLGPAQPVGRGLAPAARFSQAAGSAGNRWPSK